MNVTLPNGTVIEGVPEGTSKDVIRQKAIDSGLAEESDFPGIASTEEPKQPMMDRAINYAKGVVEPALTIGSSMGADAVAGIAGLGQIPLHASGLSDTPPADIVRALQERLTYQPESDQAKQVLGKYGEILEPVNKLIDKTRTGDETLEAGGGPLLATINEMAPDLVGAMMGIRGMNAGIPKHQPGTLSSTPLPFGDAKAGVAKAMKGRNPVVQDIQKGMPTARTAKVDLAPKTLFRPSGLKANRAAKKAVSQGWDESFVSWAKGAEKTTKTNLKDMVKIVKKRVGEGKIFGYNGQPSDVLGKSLKRRIDRVKRVQRQSGQLVDKVAKKQLTGKPVNITGAKAKFNQKIQEWGGNLNDEGKLEWGVNSRLYNQSAKQKTIQTMYEKLDDLGDLPDGYAAHKFKGDITEYVDFGKAPKEGMSRSIDNVLKDLRSDINEVLRIKSDSYRKVNQAYSEATDRLTDFQKAAGNSIDLLGPDADAAVGRVLRKLLSKQQNRENLAAAMKGIEDLAVKHGGKYTDDLTAQTFAVNEFERLMGSFAPTSFGGDIGQTLKNVAASPTVGQTGSEAVKLTAKQLSKIRYNQTTQLKALEELLK